MVGMDITALHMLHGEEVEPDARFPANTWRVDMTTGGPLFEGVAYFGSSSEASLFVKFLERITWRAAASEMPPPGVPVIAYLHNTHGMDRRIRAMYAPKNTLLLSDESDERGTYDEATNAYYSSEGWYAMNEHEETYWKVSDPVTHWMPLPDPPKE